MSLEFRVKIGTTPQLLIFFGNTRNHGITLLYRSLTIKSDFSGCILRIEEIRYQCISD